MPATFCEMSEIVIKRLHLDKMDSCLAHVMSVDSFRHVQGQESKVNVEY